MPTSTADLPRRALVLGGARSGQAAAVALAGRGVAVRLADRNTALVHALPASVDVQLGEATTPDLLDGVQLLVKSPGVPGTNEVVLAARALGLPVWSEVELGFRLLEPGVALVGVTGTNGKSTTTELVAAMIRADGREALAAGNVGVALCQVAPGCKSGSVVVCELSSFQLEDVETLRCDAAGLLNVTPDHLDRHGSMAAYVTAKLRMFERQRQQDTAVLNRSDPAVAAITAIPGAGRLIEVYAQDADAHGFASSRLLGEHNRQNVAVRCGPRPGRRYLRPGDRDGPGGLRAGPAPARDRRHA